MSLPPYLAQFYTALAKPSLESPEFSVMRVASPWVTAAECPAHTHAGHTRGSSDPQTAAVRGPVVACAQATTSTTTALSHITIITTGGTHHHHQYNLLQTHVFRIF